MFYALNITETPGITVMFGCICNVLWKVRAAEIVYNCIWVAVCYSYKIQKISKGSEN